MGKSIVAVLSNVFDVAGNPYQGDGNRNEIIHTFRHAVVNELETTVLFDVTLLDECVRNGNAWEIEDPDVLGARIAAHVGLEDQGRVRVKSSTCRRERLHAQIEIVGSGARRLDAVEHASSIHIARKLMESTKFSNMKIRKASLVLGETDAQRKKLSRSQEELGDGPVVGPGLGQAELAGVHGMLSSLQSEVSGHKEVLQQIQTNVTSQSSVPDSAASIELKLEALLKTQEEFRQAQEEFRQAQEESRQAQEEFRQAQEELRHAQEELKERVALGILVGSFFAAVAIVIYVLAPKKHDEVDGSPIL